MKDSHQPPPPACWMKMSRRVFRRKWKVVSFFGLISFGLGSLTVFAQTSMSEYQVKALFLLNFVKYVDWPAEALPQATSPIVIGILGQDNFDDNLTHAVEGKNINGREVVIRHLAADDDPTGCAILFISSSEDPRLGEILGKTAALPILTVGEDESFFKKGGIINFTLKEGKIHLEINLSVAHQVKLQISSKLLSVADVVKE